MIEIKKIIVPEGVTDVDVVRFLRHKTRYMIKDGDTQLGFISYAKRECTIHIFTETNLNSDTLYEIFSKIKELVPPATPVKFEFNC